MNLDKELHKDAYPYAPEGKLSQWMETLEYKRRVSVRNRENALNIEQEICYVFRELEIRKRRKEIHEKYMRNRYKNRAKTPRNRV
jgi:hypothetical protein